MSNDALGEVESLLQAEVDKEIAANRRTMKLGGGFVLLVAVYLFWVSGAIGQILDPTGLAQAASGFAIDAVPKAGKEVRALVVDGAPDLVRMGSDQIISMVPDYRIALQDEIGPVLDEVCSVLATTAVRELTQHAGDPAASYSTSEALQVAADAAVARVDATLNDAMDLPNEEGITPRKQIESSLTHLKRIDAQLKIMANKGGDPRERELLVAWLGVVAQHNETAEVARVEDYKVNAAVEQRAKDAREAAKPATP